MSDTPSRSKKPKAKGRRVVRKADQTSSGEKARRIERVYEGEAVLAGLLKASGCRLSVSDVQEEFLAALEEGSPSAEIIPLLWEGEPRFKGADEARRLFGNLFGLWDLVARELGEEDEAVEQDPNAPLGPRFVERAWGELDGLSEREHQRERDRFDNLQFDVAAWVFERTKGQSEIAQELAQDLAFEMWFIATRARGDERVVRLKRAALEAAFNDADRIAEEPEPALAALVSAALWEQAADEERPLPEDDIAAVEGVLRALRAGWGAAPPA